MKRPLVTGGTGFLGGALCRSLVARGERPVALDLDPRPQRLGDAAGRVEVVEADLRDFTGLVGLIQDLAPPVIYHLGAVLSLPSESAPLASLEVNALGTFHVLEAARLAGVDRVLFSSTLGTYGAAAGTTLSDHTLQRPLLFYGATKLLGEHMGLFFRRTSGLDFRGIRYPAVVGPGITSPGVAQYASHLIEAVAAGRPFTVPVASDTRIPLIYFRDAVRAMLELEAAPAGSIRTVNYLIEGCRPTPSAAELVDALAVRFPGAAVDFNPRPGLGELLGDLLDPSLRIDGSRAREEWGWAPRFDAARMIDDFLKTL